MHMGVEVRKKLSGVILFRHVDPMYPILMVSPYWLSHLSGL